MFNVFNRKKSSAATTALDVERRLAQSEPLLVLDVRQPNEYRQGRIKGSTLIPLDQLALRLDELPKDREIVVVCRSGNRSGVATALLERAGFDAINLEGGMIAWQKEKLPLERET
jgi:rhodanese-related sulfurtransferase